MPIYKGQTKIVSLYKGTAKIVKVYKGTNVVFSSGRLPSAFQEVEYIESSGTQYIDSGLPLTLTTGVSFDAQYKNGESIGVLLGVLEINVGRLQPYYLDYGTLKANYQISSNSITLTSSNLYDRYTLEFNVNNSDIKFNGVSVGTVDNIGSTTNTIYLFCRNYSASPYYASVKLYSCKFYDNGILVRDYIPCYRKADNVIGLYDSINGVFYTNAGTGTFTKGADV